MSNSNLGLNRKISSVVSKNLTDTESDIYKQISEIVSEYGDEADEDSGIVAIIERGKDNVTEFKEKRITVITQNMFSDFPNLTYLYLPNVTSIDGSAFSDCSNLTSIDLPNVTSIGNDAFYNCTSLTYLYLPNVTSIGDTAFLGCSNLTSIDLPNVTSINYNTFLGCSNLTSIDLPNVTSIGNGAFYNCTSLTSIDLPNVTSIYSQVFYGCTNLSTVIISTNQIIELDNYMVFDDTPIANGTGYIYVPNSLVNSYKSTSGWSTYASQIKPISELPQEYKTLYNIT